MKFFLCHFKNHLHQTSIQFVHQIQFKERKQFISLLSDRSTIDRRFLNNYFCFLTIFLWSSSFNQNNLWSIDSWLNGNIQFGSNLLNHNLIMRNFGEIMNKFYYRESLSVYFKLQLLKLHVKKLNRLGDILNQ